MHWSVPEAYGIGVPPAVRSHSATLVGSKVLVLGGGQEDSRLTASAFDTETQFWTKLTTWGLELPHHRAHTATLVGKSLYVVGGGSGAEYYDTVHVLNTETMIWWRPPVTGQGPGPLRAHTATAVGNKIYVFGGGNGSSVSSRVFVLDTETLIWSQVSCHAKHPKDQPGPRAFHTATLLDNNRILVFGGTDGHSCVSHVHVLNTDAHEWKRVKPYNARTVWPRLGHTATLVGRMLFVFGGFDGCDYVNEVHMLDLDTIEWVQVPPISGKPPLPRAYHAAAFHDSRVFVFGGSDDEACHSDMHLLDLGVTGYLSVPQSERSRYTPRSSFSTPTTTPRTGSAATPRLKDSTSSAGLPESS